MTQIRFFTDEDIYADVCVALRAAGFDAMSTPESGRMGESDESQLQWAEAAGRAIVEFNVADFARLHVEWLAQGQTHAGIIVSAQRPIGDLIRRLLHLGTVVDADAMRDSIRFLGDW